MKILKSKNFYFCIFIFGVTVSWWILFKSKWFTDTDSSLGFFIAIIGLLFSIMQFQIHLINRKNDYLRDIKYNEYQRLRKLINDFSNLINENMMIEPNPFNLEYSLVNIRNEISEIIKLNNNRIFKDILQKPSAKNFDTITSKIILKASQYRKSFEEAKENETKIDSPKGGQYDILFELEKFELQNKWHNETRELLKEFYRDKSKLLDELQIYLID